MSERPLISTGVPSLDHVLGGGLAPLRLYLVSGDPGSGKTTLGMQFLLEGRDRGQRGLYVSLSETREELASVATSHGWDTTGIEVFELVPSTSLEDPEQEYTMFHPSEVELSDTTRAILAEVERVQPARVVFDSLSEMRLLAQSGLRYRRQILALKQFFVGREATVMLLDDRTSDDADTHLQSLAHGVIALETRNPELGDQRRRLRIAKMRAKAYRGGWHDYRIVRGGLDVYPRLVAAEHRASRERATLTTGLPKLDQLLGGGLQEGNSVLMLGPAGCGKSSIALRIAVAAAERGERASVFAFDEAPDTLIDRGDALGMDASGHVSDGRLTVRQMDPAEMSPGEFAQLIIHEVAPPDGSPGVRVVVIDSLNGYLNAMAEDRHLAIQLHELLSYLRDRGVLAILVMAQFGLLGAVQAPVDASYLADVVMLFRFFESKGIIRQAMSVVKKRTGRHERTIREFDMQHGQITIGEPLATFRGVLAGAPVYEGETGDLLGTPDGAR